MLFRSNEVRSQKKSLVILCVRDSGYDEATRDFLAMERQVGFRNESIHNYLNLIEKLVENNYVVLRMGRHCKEDLRLDGFYDYCRDFEANDLADFFFFLNAEFCISTGFGLEEIGVFLRKRTYLINVAPLGCLKGGPIYPYSLPRKHVDLITGQTLGMNEILERGMDQAYTMQALQAINGGYESNEINLITQFTENLIRLERDYVNQSQNLVGKNNEIYISKLWPNFDSSYKNLRSSNYVFI